MIASLRRSGPLPGLLVILAALALFVSAAPASAQNFSGSIFTTFADGATVNGNIYPSKAAVFLNGGPQNTNSAGLPDGTYYFQVTDPAAKVLLSTDDVTCRQVVVSGGIFQGVPAGAPPAACTASDGGLGNFHLNGSPNPANGGSISVQLCAPSGCPAGQPDFNDTPNPGGEYKVWLTNVNDYDPIDCANFGFCNDKSKTDNFKVRVQQCTENCTTGSVTACKFWDINDNGSHDGGEPLLSGWTIDAVNTTGDGSTVKQTTDDSGCTTFTVTGFNSSPQIVTLSEELQPFWSQTAPLQGIYPGETGGDVTVTGCNFNTPPIPACTSTISVPVNAGDNVLAPDFGNTGIDLTVSKTATPTFTRTFNWSIQKLVDKTQVEQSGGSITFNYTVNVSETGFTDTNWQVNGTITVGNANAFAVTGVNVSDAVDDGGNCSITDANGGVNETVPPGGLNLPYTCTYSSQPAYNVTANNTATATWDGTKFHTPDSSASGGASFVFNSGSAGNPTNVNQTVTITDCFNSPCPPGTLTTLGTLTGTTTQPFTSHSFTYSHTVPNSAPGSCASHTNVATIVQTGQNSSQTVTVCNTNTGALTMGFWQNKNGQGIITSFCGGTSGTSLNTFLRQFNPFQDLSSTATCSQDASYVNNIIKAATCTSSTNTCNSMLRSQMLATALDVYFSTPSLGGNKVGGFNGLGGSTPALGGVAIDLSKICAMIDGSSGSTCSGVTEDARPEFGIAPPALGTTVGLMLLYSDFLSAVNGSPVASSTTGSTWYKNIKARQVIAKDAFDSINNQKALIAPPGTTASPSF